MGPFWSTLLTLAAVWLGLTWVLPYLAMWLSGGDAPVPIPAAARLMYLLLTLAGALVLGVLWRYNGSTFREKKA